MRKVLMFLFITIFIVTSCQKTPDHITENGNGIKLAEKETVIVLDSNNTLESDDMSEIPERLQLSEEFDDYSVNIDSDITRPKTELTSGQISAESVSLELVRDVLNPDADWDERDGAYYIMVPESERQPDTSEYLFSLSYGEDIENQILYDSYGYSEDFPADAETLNESDWTDEQRFYFEECQNYVYELLGKMSLSYQIIDYNLEGTKETWYSSFGLAFSIDGIPTCNISNSKAENIKNIHGSMSVNTDTVNGFYINGNYGATSNGTVEMLPWEDILKTFMAGIGESNAGRLLQEINITKIQIEYLVYDDCRYVPVWTFYNTIEGVDCTPIMCINAETGSIEYAW